MSLNNELINIVMITDENYAKPTVVAITSVIMNNSNCKIFILGNNLSPKSFSLLKTFKQVEILDCAKYISEYKSINQTRHVSYSALLKFFIPEIFQNLEKILYLDSDIIVQKDLTELYNTDIQNYYAAVIKDTITLLNKPHMQNIECSGIYFNSGVMLLNLDKMRDDNIKDKLLDYRLNRTNNFMDQDAFNAVIGKQVKYISYKYNFLNYYLDVMSIKDLSSKLFNEKMPDNEKELYDSCTIIHLGGKYKPWEYKIKYLSDLYKTYWEKSPINESMPKLIENSEKEITLKYLNEIVANKRVVLWGASIFLQKLLSKNSEVNPRILGIIDKNSDKWGEELGGYKIFSPDEVEKLQPDCVLITVKSNHKKIYSQIQYELFQKYPYIEVLPDIFEDNYSEKDLILKQRSKITLLETMLKEYKKKTEEQFNELMNAQIFNNLINSSTWVKRRDFIPVGGAATYTFLYYLYIILEYIEPKNILELGMGQTSKLTAQYAAYKNQNSNLQIIEHDKEWIKYFSKQLPNDSNIIALDLEDFEYKNTLNSRYSNLSKITLDNKYDLIIIDGPYGYTCKYPRSNILELIPNNLASDFIIILDDYERAGEQNTAKLIFDKLEQSNIKYASKVKSGVKKQLIIMSESYKFLSFY